jgi:hypothetical protein
MIPPLHNLVWTQIVTGRKPVTSTKLAINLLVKNVQMSYARDQSPENVQVLVQRAREFFTTNERVFDEEFKRILS